MPLYNNLKTKKCHYTTTYFEKSGSQRDRFMRRFRAPSGRSNERAGRPLYGTPQSPLTGMSDSAAAVPVASPGGTPCSLL